MKFRLLFYIIIAALCIGWSDSYAKDSLKIAGFVMRLNAAVPDLESVSYINGLPSDPPNLPSCSGATLPPDYWITIGDAIALRKGWSISHIWIDGKTKKVSGQMPGTCREDCEEDVK